VPLDPTMRLVLDQLESAGARPFHELTPEEARQQFEQFKLPAPEIALASVEDLDVPGPAGGVRVRVYRPEGEGARPALVYFHGGGWVIGSVETHDGTCRELAHGAGCVVVSVEYRRAPEHRYPAAAEDCYAVTRWVADRADALGVDGSRLAVGGDSAGGNLAAVVALMARDRGGPSLRYQLLIYPVTDADFERPSYHDNAEGYLLTRDAMRWFWDLYVPEPAQRADAYAAPLRAADLAGLPSAHVITAEYDPLRDEGEAYARRLSKAGVPTTARRYDGVIHGFFALGMIAPVGREAIAEAATRLRTALGA